MAIKLYPPMIEGTIPAFYGTVLTVPFSMNKTVSKQDVHGMQIKIKAVQSSAYILTEEASEIIYEPQCKAIFKFSENNQKLKQGQHYKIQLAYVGSDGTVGYFSTIAIVKYTTKPEIAIQGLDYQVINKHQYNYIGTYTNEDLSEKVYTYCFNLYDNKNKLVETSGERFHNSEDDIIKVDNNENLIIEQYDNYAIPQDLKNGQNYVLEYQVSTLNELWIVSQRYRIAQQPSVEPELKASLTTAMNFENGYVDLNLKGEKDEDGIELAATGTFKILRAENDMWHEVHRFALYGQQPSTWHWRDYLVEQGTEYKYAVQQYNEAGLVSNRIESEPVYADFEHSFLFDGKRQLKIKFNPKVSNFKNNILESKLNTIGSQHPFIFRNGKVRYKEFGISGLISCQSDNEFLFMSEEDLEGYDLSTNLTNENIKAERDFKLEVMEWLNNGEPKVFRSATEGNYIVRLLNVSLSPNDTVGRMLHTFTSTAYEIAEYNYQNLSDLHFISIGNPAEKQLLWETLEFNGIVSGNVLEHYPVNSLQFEFMPVGETIYINDGIYHEGVGKDNGFYITIGETGEYILSLDANINISEVSFIGGKTHNASRLTYSYYSDDLNVFNKIRSVENVDVIAEQYFGEHDIIAKIENSDEDNISYKVVNIYQINCLLRNRETLYLKGENYYIDINCTNQFINFDPYILYDIKDYANDNLLYLLDGYDLRKYENEYSSMFYLNDTKIDLAEINEYTINSPEDVKKLITGNGVIMSITYQKQIIKEG